MDIVKEKIKQARTLLDELDIDLWLLLVLTTVILAGLAGCGPGPGNEAARTAWPTNLTVEVNDQRMDLTWTKQGDGAIGGYYIYISREPLVARYAGPEINPSVETYNQTPFPGDTNPEDGVERFVATSLNNGVKYYVSVRVVFPDRTVSEPSNEVAVVCGPRGDIELGLRFQAEHDGYSFEKNAYVPADDSYNDLFFFSKDGVDYLCSPRRLNGFINDTRMLVLPFGGTYDEVKDRVADSTLIATADRVEIGPGDWVLLTCQSGGHALVQVQSINGTGKDRRVKLFFAFSALTDEVFF